MSVRAAPSIRQQLQWLVQGAHTVNTARLHLKGVGHAWAARLASFAPVTSPVQKVAARNALLAIIPPMPWHSTVMFVARVAHKHYLDSARATHAAPVGWHARLLSSAVNAFEVASLMVTQGGVNAAPLVNSLPESAQSLAQPVLRDSTATTVPLRVAHVL